MTESDVREYGKNPSLVIFPALAQGKEIYHAEAVVASAETVKDEGEIQ